MFHDRGVLCTSAVVLLATTLLSASSLESQVLRGVVRVREGERPIDRARIVAEDRAGKRIGEAVSGTDGRYQLIVLGKIGEPFRVTVSRIGMRPSMSDEITLAAEDTVNADFWVRDLPAEVEEVRTTATASLNATRYADARRRGWRVIEPEVIEARRETAAGFNQLLSTLGIPGLIIPSQPGVCIRSVRNNQCLSVILDGVLIGPSVHLNPRDIYFMAIVSASDSRAEWGDRAPYGAIALYTRMNGDKRRP
jgi:hypothetical protein